jgi:hypothetical protein
MIVLKLQGIAKSAHDESAKPVLNTALIQGRAAGSCQKHRRSRTSAASS